MQLIRGIALLCAGTLMGCAHYQPAPDLAPEESITVTFMAPGLLAQPMVCTPEGRFVSTRQSLTASPFQGALMDEAANLLRKAETVTVTLDGTRPVTVGVRYSERSRGSSNKRCRQALTFSPGPGAHYDVVFTLSGNECTLSVTDETGTPPSDASPSAWHCP